MFKKKKAIFKVIQKSNKKALKAILIMTKKKTNKKKYNKTIIEIIKNYYYKLFKPLKSLCVVCPLIFIMNLFLPLFLQFIFKVCIYCSLYFSKLW